MTSFDTPTVVARGLRFPEGPVACADGSVLVVEIEGDSVARIDPGGDVTRWSVGRGPNGAAIGPDGALYIATDGGLHFTTDGDIRYPDDIAEGNAGGSMQRLDLRTGAVSTLLTQSADEPLGQLNDVVFDGAGCCYVVDTLHGRIHYVDVLAGTATIAHDGLELPNGFGLAPDGTRAYVSETYSGRIFALSVQAPGMLGDRTLLHATGEHGWDGLAVDGAGNVCVANLQHSGITVISPDGDELGALVLPAPDPFVTNICFGGAGAATAFVCSSGRGLLYSLRWPWPGLAVGYGL